MRCRRPARGRGLRATAIGSNNIVEGIFYGLARFARAEPVDSDEHPRSTGTQRDLRQRLVRRSVGQRVAPHGGRRRWFVDGDRAMVAAPSDTDAGVTINTTLDAKRRHRCRWRMMACGLCLGFLVP